MPIYRTVIISRLTRNSGDYGDILEDFDSAFDLEVPSEKIRIQGAYHEDSEEIVKLDGAFVIKSKINDLLKWCKQGAESNLSSLNPKLFRIFLKNIRISENSPAFFDPEVHHLSLFVHWGSNSLAEYKYYCSRLNRLLELAEMPNVKAGYYSSAGGDPLYKIIKDSPTDLEAVEAISRQLWFSQEFFQLGEEILLRAIAERKTAGAVNPSFKLTPVQHQILHDIVKQREADTPELELLTKIIPDFSASDIVFDEEVDLEIFRDEFLKIIQSYPHPIY